MDPSHCSLSSISCPFLSFLSFAVPPHCLLIIIPFQLMSTLFNFPILFFRPHFISVLLFTFFLLFSTKLYILPSIFLSFPHFFSLYRCPFIPFAFFFTFPFLEHSFLLRVVVPSIPQTVSPFFLPGKWRIKNGHLITPGNSILITRRQKLSLWWIH